MRIAGAPNFTVLSTIAKGVQKLEVPDLVDGTYEVRAVVVNGSKRSKGVVKSGKVESVPGDVSEFSVAFE